MRKITSLQTLTKIRARGSTGFNSEIIVMNYYCYSYFVERKFKVVSGAKWVAIMFTNLSS